jgi:hypothetical protein
MFACQMSQTGGREARACAVQRSPWLRSVRVAWLFAALTAVVVRGEN